MISFFKQILRRSPFPGQLRLFHFLYYNGWLKNDKYQITIPRVGNFALFVNPLNLIDANIIYTGDYESSLKAVFKSFIKPGDVVYDIGANIGFHTLYFSELVGPGGTVFAFEPIQMNYQALKNNLQLNNSKNVFVNCFALGAKSGKLKIHIDMAQSNPGAYHLFEKESPNFEIDIRTGDEIAVNSGLQALNFVKIDVEGYEQFVLEGLLETIKKHQPCVVFEFDRNYQLRAGLMPGEIFNFFSLLQYRLFRIESNALAPFEYTNNIKSANIFALPFYSPNNFMQLEKVH